MCRKPVVSRMNPRMTFLSSKNSILTHIKQCLPKKGEENEQSCMPRWLKNRKMKNQILDEKWCEALREILSSGKVMPWSNTYFRLEIFSRTGWPLESFSMPWFCILPINILTKCFHLDLISTGFGVLPCFYNSEAGDLTSILAIPDWNSFSKSYF